jgi:hypothetical protein
MKQTNFKATAEPVIHIQQIACQFQIVACNTLNLLHFGCGEYRVK